MFWLISTHVYVRFAFLINQLPALLTVQPWGTSSLNIVVLSAIFVIILTIVHVNIFRSLSAQLLRYIQLLSFTPALDQTQQVRSRILARGEVIPCSLLSQLWPAASSHNAHWGSGQSEEATSRCLDS